jgi:circadian clock protein KaiB
MTAAVESPIVRLRLYVAGGAQNSLAAVCNLQDICERFLPARHQIELVDVLKEPKRALADGVLMTPMLVKLAPLPVSKVVGSLSQTEVVLQALGLSALAA